MKIATWNVNSLRVRLPQVIDWLAVESPDVLVLQETKLPDTDFPAAAFAETGYQVVFSGQKTYNGVAILSRLPSTEIVTDIPDLTDPQRRVLVATVGPLRLFNLYVPNGESITSTKYEYKLDWLAKLAAFVQTELLQHPHVVLLGDFNIAPDDRDVHDPAAWAGQVLCSDPERQALQALLGLGLEDCFRLQEQPPATYSWWDYRMNAFKRNRGLANRFNFGKQGVSCPLR